MEGVAVTLPVIAGLRQTEQQLVYDNTNYEYILNLQLFEL